MGSRSDCSLRVSEFLAWLDETPANRELARPRTAAGPTPVSSRM